MCDDSKRLIVAVDGGGSTCRACVARLDGHIVGRATGRSANITTDFSKSRKNILETVGRAYEDAGLASERSSFDYAYLGLAGGSIGDAARKLQASLDFFRARVTTDRETTVQGAMGAGDGTVALFGTGSFYVARHGGVSRGVGGWGFRLCDDGGGAYLGLAFLRSVIRAHDGLIEHSPLSLAILQRYGGTAGQIVAFAQTATPKEFGSIAPEITDAFQQGDRIATEIIGQAVGRMEDTLDQLDALNNGPLFLLGGLGPFYQERLRANLRAICQTPAGDALAGAVSLAQAELVGQDHEH